MQSSEAPGLLVWQSEVLWVVGSVQWSHGDAEPPGGGTPRVCAAFSRKDQGSPRGAKLGPDVRGGQQVSNKTRENNLESLPERRWLKCNELDIYIGMCEIKV